ncbi:MAG: aminodeoxychorismate synthase component I [Bacteroidetes bacterium]|nr:MAG: aminodeoxychorismate synthase component I [Bacteroidota bacterium]
MKRIFRTFPIKEFRKTRLQMLSWASQFNICSFLDNHQYHLPGHSYECLAGVGMIHKIEASAGNALRKFQEFVNANRDWCLGHFAYDLKNEIEDLHSHHSDFIQFPDLFFFVPEIVLILKENQISIGVFDHSHETIFETISSCDYNLPDKKFHTPIIKNRISREKYLETINALQYHIRRGDCYEINFCQEFYADEIEIDPLRLYLGLSAVSPSPFSAYYKIDDKWLLCLSPERFLKKTGPQIISQPMKGTWKRNTKDEVLDEINRKNLQESKKDRSENVMVVDLVRNDFSRICKEGSVHVEEMFSIQTFPLVHQMVSTVKGILSDDITMDQLIRACFPMGSMTGAPKKRVMELIEEFEESRRGLFSGAVGYVAPNGDCDFNVVIRSVLYNSSNKYLSFPAGSGITHFSDPEKEYEECLLKAKAIKKVLEQSPTPHKNLS